ncbi:MAG: hypothetical protein U5K36_01555 [Roseovarius sp.]|nr:hypothetical protein [Roseovarius sp.]
MLDTPGAWHTTSRRTAAVRQFVAEPSAQPPVCLAGRRARRSRRAFGWARSAAACFGGDRRSASRSNSRSIRLLQIRRACASRWDEVLADVAHQRRRHRAHQQHEGKGRDDRNGAQAFKPSGQKQDDDNEKLQAAQQQRATTRVGFETPLDVNMPSTKVAESAEVTRNMHTSRIASDGRSRRSAAAGPSST